MVTKMSKMTNFFVFSPDASKISVTVWTKYLRASKKFYLTLSEDTID